MREAIPSEKNVTHLNTKATAAEVRLWRVMQQEVMAAVNKVCFTNLANADIGEVTTQLHAEPQANSYNNMVYIELPEDEHGYRATLAIQMRMQFPRVENPDYDANQPEQWDY